MKEVTIDPQQFIFYLKTSTIRWKGGVLRRSSDDMDTHLITPCSWSLSTGKLPWHLNDGCFNRSEILELHVSLLSKDLHDVYTMWDLEPSLAQKFILPQLNHVSLRPNKACLTNHPFSLNSKSSSTKHILEWITLHFWKVQRESLPYPCKHIMRNCSTSVCHTISKRPPLREVSHWLGPWGLLNIVHRNARFLRLMSLQLLLLPKYQKNSEHRSLPK